MDLTAAYRDKSASLPSKAVLSVVHFGIVLIVLWMFFGNGAAILDLKLGVEHHNAPFLRRAALAAAAMLYFLRTLATVFVFCRRRMPWSEVMTIAVWIGILDILLAYFGSRNETSMGSLGIAGGCLVAIGSLINTGSEWQRHAWKRDPERSGHLITKGMWGAARHINYFGDVVLFCGWALLTGKLVFLIVPAVMICLFSFINIPAQDRYLAERYGEEYAAYAKRTAKLIPYVY